MRHCAASTNGRDSRSPRSSCGWPSSSDGSSAPRRAAAPEQGSRAAAATAGAASDPTLPTRRSVVELLRAGKEVQATALVHKQKGSGLAEAKAEVDRLKAQLSL